MTSDFWSVQLLLVVLVFVPGPILAQTRIEAPRGVAAQSITNSPINIYNRDPEEIERLSKQLPPRCLGWVETSSPCLDMRRCPPRDVSWFG